MIIAPRDFDFEGSGFKGAEFEQKGMEERNLQVLLKSLSNKTTLKSIESLSKIDRDDWTAMAATATMLNSFVALGGTGELLSSIKTTIDLKIAEFLSPLENNINQAISDIITPFITDILTPLMNDLSAFLSENSFGAGVGGIAGNILASFLPGGNIWVVVFAALGAYLEESIGKLLRGETGVDVWSAFADAAFDRILEVTDNLGAGTGGTGPSNRIGGFQDVF